MNGSAAKEFYEKNKRLVLILAILAPVAAFGIAYAVAPAVVYDHFIWEDIWGPTLVDAKQSDPLCLTPAHEITPAKRVPGTAGDWACAGEGVVAQGGYTLTSELTYGIVLAILLYAIYNGILRRFKIITDGAFTFALIPYILMGPVVRSLEDANLFLLPGTTEEANAFAWMFISPWIYFNIAFFAIAGLLFGVFLERAMKSGADARMLATVFAAGPAIQVAGYAFIFSQYGDTFHALANPVWPFLAALAGILIVYWYALKEKLTKNHVLFAFGLPLIAWPAALQARWLLGGAWTTSGKGLHFEAGFIIIGLVLAVTLLVHGLARLLLKRGVQPAVLYTRPFNVALIAAHMLDGFATYVAIGDPFNLGLVGYSEKHPVSLAFLELFGDSFLAGMAFPAVKLLMVLVIIWLLDREYLAYELSGRATATVAMSVDASDADDEATSADDVVAPADVDALAMAATREAEGVPDVEAPPVETEEDRERIANDRNLVGLIKMAIFVLGFAPGFRDFLLLVQGF